MFRLITHRSGITFLVSCLRDRLVPRAGVGKGGEAGHDPGRRLACGNGALYTGAGLFNEKTAIADSINPDTLIRWNDYLFQANLEAAAHVSGTAKILPITWHRTTRSSRDTGHPTLRASRRATRLNAAINQITDPRFPVRP